MKNIDSYAWSFLGKFGLQAIYLLSNIILARLLTPSDFGVIGVLAVIFSVAQTLSDSGLGGALIMEKELNRINCGTIFIFNATISFCFYLIIYICSPILESFYDIDNLSKVARLLGLVFVFHALGIVPKSILTYQLKFKIISLITIISVLVSAFCSILLAIFHAGVYSLVVFQLLNALLSSILYISIAKYRIYLCFDKQSFTRMFKFGLFTTITNVIDSLYENLIAAIFGKMIGVREAGFFSQAKKLEEASIQSLVLTVNTTAFPVLSKIRSQLSLFIHEAESLKKTVPLFVAPLLIFIGVYANEIIILLFGNEWISSSTYLSQLMIAGFFMLNESINRNFIKSLGEVKSLFLSTLFKRILGFIIIIIACVFSTKLILLGYILSAIIGYLINAIVYSNLTKGNTLKYLINSFVDFSPIVPLVVFVCVMHMILPVWLSIVFSFVMFFLYYIFIFHLLGFSISRVINWISQIK